MNPHPASRWRGTMSRPSPPSRLARLARDVAAAVALGGCAWCVILWAILSAGAAHGEEPATAWLTSRYVYDCRVVNSGIAVSRAEIELHRAYQHHPAAVCAALRFFCDVHVTTTSQGMDPSRAPIAITGRDGWTITCPPAPEPRPAQEPHQ
jgi:hypothetical protein